jgi:hypothetical protein
MKPAQVKAFLFERRLTVSMMAREMSADYPIAFDSLRVMIGDVLFGRRYFPRLASLLNERYGLGIERPGKPDGRKNAQKARKGL